MVAFHRLQGKGRLFHPPGRVAAFCETGLRWAVAALLAVLGLAGHLGVTSSLRAESPPQVTLQLSLQEDGVLLDWQVLLDEITLQYRDSLSEGEWLPCPPEEQWPMSASSYLDGRPLGGARFYRIIRPASGSRRGSLLSVEHVRTLGVFEISLVMSLAGVTGMTPVYGVDVYTILYRTVDAHGKSTVASGSLAVPRGTSDRLPLASYQHGTILHKEEAPSRLGSPESLPGVILGSTGYVAVSPDYLGLGEGPGLHPYVLTKPTATAVVDMLRAARTFLLTSSEVSLNDQLFLVGVSQGGHATMAAHREIEQYHSDEFTITASAPVSGPYDLSGTMADRMISSEPYPAPYYLPYAFMAYNEAYQLYDSLEEVFVEPYASTIPALLDGRHTSDEVLASLPSVPRQMLRPEFLDAFESDPNHPLRAALRANDLYDWAPKAPMRLYHCAGDLTVPKASSEIALARFHENGATHVTLHDPLPTADHGGCSMPSLLLIKAWFDALKE
jgi:hypothetical protein